MKSDLTQEQVLEEFDYDYVNGWLIRKEDEHGRPYNKPCGHKPDCNGYGSVRIGGKMYKAHRVIWLWHHGSWPEHEIDHINQNRIDNRIENLRSVTKSENQHNAGARKDNSSGYTGVSFNKRANKFIAHIRVDNKRIHLGYFNTAEEAYIAHIRVDNKRIHLGYFNTAEEAYLAYQLAKIKYHPTSPIAQEYLRELTLAG